MVSEGDIKLEHSHQMETPKKKEMNSLGLHIVTGYDLEEQAETMSRSWSSACSPSQKERSTRAQRLEKAIRTKKEQTVEVRQPPHRARFTSSPSQNASRFCRKPKERAVSEGGSPLHTVDGHQSIRIESPCQVSVTSLNANIRLPMDRLSTKLFNPPERSPRTTHPERNQNGTSCFGCHGRRSRQYVIHPEWVSESLSIGKAQLTDRGGGNDSTDHMKRSQSCPPLNRNIITWESKYITDSRQGMLN